MDNNEILKEKGITVTPTMTTPTRPGKKPRPVFEVSTLTHKYDQVIRDAGGKRWRGKWSFWDDPTEELADLVKENGGSTYADQKDNERSRAEDRAERMNDRAATAQQRSSAAYQKSNDYVSGIPMGQPILVGHHSERGHRNALKKSDSAMRKSIEEKDKAKHYQGRAAAAQRTASGNHSIAFIGRRIEEAEADIRRLEREITEAREKMNTNWHRRNTLLKEECQDKLDFWKSELDKAGGVQYSKENINVGDLINYRKYGWYEVIRVNKKTVTIKGWLNVDTMTWKAPYPEITGHKPKPVET